MRVGLHLGVGAEHRPSTFAVPQEKPKQPVRQLLRNFGQRQESLRSRWADCLIGSAQIFPLFAFLISAAAAPFVFLGTSVAALIGMVFWGIGMSAQGSLLQAILTGVIPPQKRSTAFGLFDTGYGIAWFLGSAVMGLLYEKSILAVALFSVCLQLAALPIFFIANKKR